VNHRKENPIRRTQNSKPSPGGKIGSYPCLLPSIAWIIFPLAYLHFYINIALEKKNKNFIAS
jgi:hypothetical protein